MDKSVKNKQAWDWAGIFISGICIVHCLLVPAILLLAPGVMAEILPNEDLTHAILMAFILGVAGVTFFKGYSLHQNIRPVLWMVAGVLLVAYATYFVHARLGHMWEPLFAIAGSICLIRAHILNRHHCKLCEQHHIEHDHEQKDECSHTH